MIKTCLAMLFGGLLAAFGFPITTYKFWVLIVLFTIYGLIPDKN